MKSLAMIAACVVTVSVGSTSVASAAEAKAQGLLDGKTFVGQVCAKGKTEGDADVLMFKGGRFHSLACDKFGFGDAAYTAKADGGSIAFSAETTSDGGTITWTGRAVGNSVDGTMVFHRKKTWYNFFLPSTEEKIFKAESK